MTGPHAQAAKADGLNAAGTAGASTPAGIASLLGGDRRGSRSRARRDASCSTRHLADGTPADELLAGAGPGPISDDGSLLGHVDAVIAANPKAVEDYRAGKPVDRVLRRPGHEGDRRGGGRRARDRARPRAPGRGRLIPMAVRRARPDRRRRRPDRRRRAARARPVPAVQGAQGAGRERRPLRGSGAAACGRTRRPARRSPWRSSAARPRSAARSSGPASWPS